jgi:hypothetical protein
MPAFICEIRSGLKPAIKAQLARAEKKRLSWVLENSLELRRAGHF